MQSLLSFASEDLVGINSKFNASSKIHFKGGFHLCYPCYTMSYSYSNPYAQPQAQSSRPFTTSSSSEPCQILFGGLPPDSSEHDLKVCPILAAHGTVLTVIGTTHKSNVGAFEPWTICQGTVLGRRETTRNGIGPSRE